MTQFDKRVRQTSALRSLCSVMVLVIAPFVSVYGMSRSPAIEPEVIRLWEGEAPGTDRTIGPERTSKSTGPVGEITVINDVTVPTMTIYRAPAGDANGTAMMVLPGGAFAGLAWDVEGTEIAHWLNERGITAVLLKYRVHPFPVSPEEYVKLGVEQLLDLLQPARKVAVEDATQAMRVLRKRAIEFGIDSQRIGMIGFSAGAATTMGVLLEAPKDAQPNFAAPIYGMTMIESAKVTEDAPPIFIAAAQDDATLPASKSLEIFSLWTAAKRPAELHLFEKGGHGFGVRKRGWPVDKWSDSLEAWLTANGFMH